MHAKRGTLPACLLAAVGWLVPAVGLAQPADLSVEQAQLQEKFARLESLAVRIAEFVESDNPDRAQQLRDAIGKSRDLALRDRFEAIVTLLEQERYAAAQRDQGQLADNLETLLGLLLADPREARLEAERKQLKQAIQDVGKLIREQNALRSETLDSEDPSGGVEPQNALEKRAEGVEQSLDELIKKSDPSAGDGQTPQQPSGEPSDQGQAAKQRAGQRLSDARSAMKKASGQMGEGDSQGAADAQTEAQRQLEETRAELEEALRQTREEEAMRTLTRLAARLRRVLSEQTEINRLTVEVQELHGDAVSPQKRSASAGLAKRQDEAASIVDGALRLLSEEGSSVAFVEVLDQVREDMTSVSGRLMGSKCGSLTQAIEQDIVDALDEAIAALDSQLAEMANKDQQEQQQSGGGGGAMQEPPLVDQLAELRMIRSLQVRVLKRTRRLQESRKGEQIAEEDFRQMLDDLSERQERAVEAALRLSQQ
ncbi:hypothetical protein KOR34_04580 [Posidoniimonas corsicana]|uniref:Chromosome partition protein Smc n=1 Tax=Posidoniimonas corsicana TaxID=1938618 RepID=A0A5C5VD31_9BACT|nr:hypothetical protein [Posidoniimonas corsicana]TWT35565.1 hypothetical protein KOR34_04580 [Posidoniimonas corsicana]